MSDIPARDQKFIEQLRETIEQHMSDEQFGVSELAEAVGMSRSNLLRKIKKLLGLSVSQLIRQVRLERAMELLKDSELNVSEVSFEVGFASTSYFVKCFREQYGYPPGEAQERFQQENTVASVELLTVSNRKRLIIGLVALALLACVVFLFWKLSDADQDLTEVEKSIAVLPFKNDSSDTTNVYFINGLMESTLNNLQKIGDLRVISRTSSEKYRNSPKLIPEIAEELNVNYFVEGSGQKIGDRIMLNIQLIEASTDKQLWAEQYERKAEDVFKMQQEIASSIASRIKVLITPDEREQIGKVPTQNLIAYDNFLKGIDLVIVGDKQKNMAAIPYFKKAIELDKTFAYAYASLAFAYYNLDLFMADRQYIDEIDYNAEQAMKYDPELAESHIAMAFTHMQRMDYAGALPYLEQALEYKPNSASVINLLSDFYANYLPNTEKYLEYALLGIQLNVNANDSSTTSYIYLHLCNALIQTGFVDEALYYADRSLDYNPQNPFTNYVRAFMLYAKEKDYEKLRSRLITEWKKDTTRLDILQEIGKVSYFMRDYETAHEYYSLFLDMRDQMHLDIYRYEQAKIAVVFDEVGEHEKAQSLLKGYLDFTLYADNSVYKEANLAVYYAYTGEEEKAMEHLETFSRVENFQYWLILFDHDPLFDSISDRPEFQAAWTRIKNKFWSDHERLKTQLREKGLL
ncbi:helix-turn-helix domain-containing protein [Roseivirga sp.]|uniref:helix-turn-helix domain-containing protein n=1 Tax=Roseivirga sp. TaxID=1964215 RepID=UPI003B523E04